MPHQRGSSRHGGFTLVELVMVVTIIGMITAIAVPRITNASNNAASSALEATMVNVRNAIDCYYAEHDRFPGQDPATGAPDDDQFVNQLTMYSDDQGHTKATRGYPYIFGPYLRAPFPMNPATKSRSVFVMKDASGALPSDDRYGWVAILSDGDFDVSDFGLDVVPIDDGGVGRVGSGMGRVTLLESP
ncbi:MAG: type II secretion system protein [Planctomycetes bacterium]|nr:type II secretion system protein [Planctomycetota bacterium]MBI3832763.1 type II secretion system protein [Planctomycetota bacterium]